MKIGIICAVSREYQPYLEALTNKEEVKIAKFTFHTGELFGNQVAIVHSGVAKVNAALATQILIDKFKCDFIILSGTAGALDPDLKIGDTIVPERLHYHDVEVMNMADHFPFVPNAVFHASKKFLNIASTIKAKLGLNIKFGDFACGENFIKGTRRKEIREQLKAIAVDMETASVAHTCYIYDIPFGVVKSITDCPKNDSQDHFEENVVDASKNSFQVVKEIVMAMA